MEFKNPDLNAPPTLPVEAWEREPTSSELSAWRKLIGQYQRAGDAIDACNLMFENMRQLQVFATDNGVEIPYVDPSIEKRFQEVLSQFNGLKRAIRGVEDHTLGLHYRYKLSPSGNTSFDDIDIVAPSEEVAKQHGFGSASFGAIGIIIVGVVVLVGAIAAAYWATQNAIEISQQARALVKKADAALCSDPDSSICQKWQADKLESKFDDKESLAESITAGVTKVGSGLVIGALALLAVGLLWKGRK